MYMYIMEISSFRRLDTSMGVLYKEYTRHLPIRASSRKKALDILSSISERHFKSCVKRVLKYKDAYMKKQIAIEFLICKKFF